jgi:hypothetical protein
MMEGRKEPAGSAETGRFYQVSTYGQFRMDIDQFDELVKRLIFHHEASDRRIRLKI